MEKQNINIPNSPPIPIIRVGKIGPKVAIINGLHGLEKSGALIMRRLVEKVPETFGAQLTLIPFANVSSLIANSRNTPEDNLDLNRVFPGTAKGSLTEQIAFSLFNFLKKFDLVVDIHNFPKMRMPIVAVFFNSGTETSKSKVKSLVYEFSPDYIWKLDTLSDERGKAGSLVEALLNLGVPSFAFEAPDIELITNNQINHCVEGLLKAIRSLSTPKKLAKNDKNIKVIERKFCLAPIDGLFEPLVKLDAEILPGTVIGKVYDLTDFSENSVVATEQGTALFVLNNTTVRQGDRVVVIGKEITF